MVDQKAKDKHSAGLTGKKQKPHKATSSKPKELVIDGSLVRLPAGYFKDEDGDDTPQISFGDVTVDARGVAVCNPADAKPFIDDAKSLSSDALGLLITSDI